ncbi:DNA/RNA helicase domain-containing protein [Frisingicoccus caecimuris]|uniref:DNA/RNA helicase domain-containing protein n=1 Tax=Frisingicoccus caecimuris TaxID=1796636 RepID=UPI002FE5D744
MIEKKWKLVHATQTFISDEKLKEYIQYIYYVLMTRGIRGTYLYVCDSELRKYISQYVDTL